MSELIVYTKLCSDAEEKSFSSCFESEYTILDNPEALSSLSAWYNPGYHCTRGSISCQRYLESYWRHATP